MAIQIVRYSDSNVEKWGVLASEAPCAPEDDIAIRTINTDAQTTAELIKENDTSGLSISEQEFTVSASQLVSPVTSDGKIVCQGLNYMEHSAEDAGVAERLKNLIFMKASSTISGPYDNIIKPSDVELLDYEVEIGLVLRQPVSRDSMINQENIGDYVGAVVLCNDVSARDVMFGASFLQWFNGKSRRSFCPTGPVLYLLDKTEVSETLDNLDFDLVWREEIRQEGCSSDMIFKPSDTLNTLANLMDMNTGDLLLTGTPGGVIAKGSPKIFGVICDNLLDDNKRTDELIAEMKESVSDFMQPGDKVICSLTDKSTGIFLGKQVNVVVQG